MSLILVGCDNSNFTVVLCGVVCCSVSTMVKCDIILLRITWYGVLTTFRVVTLEQHATLP